MTGTSNAWVSTMDMPILDEVFVIRDGFVRHFPNRTIDDTIREELQHEKAHLIQWTRLS